MILGGQYTPFWGGQHAPFWGGQYERFFHSVYRCSVVQLSWCIGLVANYSSWSGSAAILKLSSAVG